LPGKGWLIADYDQQKRKERVSPKIGALLGAALVVAFCAHPASASLKRVIIVERFDAGAPGLLDVERGNPKERTASERRTQESPAAPNETR
jgi:hypothetical protein